MKKMKCCEYGPWSNIGYRGQFGRLLALHTNIRPGWKSLPWSNAPAYLKFSFLKKKKSFLTLTPGFNVINLFSFVADDEAK
jgi:hypothetical protein